VLLKHGLCCVCCQAQRRSEATRAYANATARYQELATALAARTSRSSSSHGSGSSSSRVAQEDWALLNTVERRKLADALKLWKFAAELGLPLAAHSLGVALERGAGSCLGPWTEAQGLAEAAAWFLKAALSGHVDAQVHLASLHARVSCRLRVGQRRILRRACNGRGQALLRLLKVAGWLFKRPTLLHLLTPALAPALSRRNLAPPPPLRRPGPRRAPKRL